MKCTKYETSGPIYQTVVSLTADQGVTSLTCIFISLFFNRCCQFNLESIGKVNLDLCCTVVQRGKSMKIMDCDYAILNIVLKKAILRERQLESFNIIFQLYREARRTGLPDSFDSF